MANRPPKAAPPRFDAPSRHVSGEMGLGTNPAGLPAEAEHGGTDMIELEPGNALDIALQDDGHGRDRVLLTLQTHARALSLTPHQARVLATELIMAVNRAEVRSNLKHDQNTVRASDQVTQKRRLFHPAF